jgi:glycosyltransferase involved in cell wall biosynthesis
MDTDLFFVIDFGAKNKYTHHSPLIQRYSEIIWARNKNLFVLLPQYADKTAFYRTKGEIKYNLVSPVFGPSFNEMPLTFLIFRLTGFLIHNNKKGLYIKKWFRRILIRRARVFVLSTCMEPKKRANIIFPTTDPLSVELAESLIKIISPESQFIFRMVGGESRGLHSSHNELKVLKSLTIKYPSQIRIGYETDGYRDLLIRAGFEPEVLYWSPWPKIDYTGKGISLPTKLRIGFLGTAKKRKGFDLIPQITAQLIKSKINFSLRIQTTDYKWDQYFKTIDDLKLNYNENCTFLEAVLSLEDLQKEIKNLDLILLPYDSESYAINASGLLYHACDYEVPVATFKGVGFASEIEKYNIGFVFQNLNEIPEICNMVVYEKNKYKFDSYNRQRELATNNFLFE